MIELKEQHIAVATLAFLIMLALVAIFRLAETKKSTDFTQKESINLVGLACAYKNDQLIGCRRNIIVNTGKEWLEKAISTGNVGLMNYLALGNTSVPTKDSTSLPGEITVCGLARKPATIKDNGNGNWTLTATWIGEVYGGTISCDNIKVNTTGTYNASTGGTFIAGTAVAEAIVSRTDNYTIEYTFLIGE